VLLLSIAICATAQDWQKLGGELGSSETYKSGWLDLAPPLTFTKGEKLRITVGGTAVKIIVRLLPVGASPGDQTGIVGEYKVSDKRAVVVTLGEDHEQVKQVSVHGGPNPWGVWDLGGNNGPATIKTVERSTR
jgi:hypothetical protein